MLSIQAMGPNSIRDAVNTIKQWQKRAGVDAAVFKGKWTLTQMLELPVRAAYQAMVAMMQIDSKAAREHGLNTCWMDNDRKWSISLNGKALIRGKTDLAELEAQVHINLEHFEAEGADQIVRSMEEFEGRDRVGALCEIQYNQIEKFMGDPWGRQPRRTSS